MYLGLPNLGLHPANVGVPSLNLDFISTETPNNRLTISGGSGGTRVNSSGNIVSASAPRFDYDPVSLAARGLLVEEQRTNLLLRSAEFDNASWVKTNSSVTANAATGPDGTVSADKIVPANAATNGIASQTPTVVASTVYTFTFYIKQAEQSTLSLVSNLTGSFIRNTFDASNGTVTASGAGWANAIQAVGNGWYRCTSTATSGASTTSASFQLGNNSIWVGDGTSGVYVWGAQLEAGSFATSYIPTTTAQVTRTADSEAITGGNFTPWFNAAQGTIYAEFDLIGKYTSGTNQNVLAITDGGGSGANRIFIYQNVTSDRVFGQVDAASVNQFSQTNAGSLAINTVRKVALAYASGDFAFAENGLAPTTQASGSLPTGLTALNIGINSAGSGAYLNGHIRRIRFYSQRLPNAQLQVLTQ